MTYFEEWADTAMRGISSYLNVAKEMSAERLYHYSRANYPEHDGSTPDTVFTIPLLWGSF